jgi:multidrug transporter EmrE-like cation transporter
MTNPLVSYAILAFYVVISVLGLTLLKLADRAVSLTSFAGAFLYVAGAAIWLFVILRALPLSFAFPIAAGALIAGSQLSGWAILSEPLSRTHIIGVAVIFLGIVLLGSSRSSDEAAATSPAATRTGSSSVE